MDKMQLLRAFVRIADLGTLTAAAADLRVGQSTVSKWLAALERDAGVSLFDRTTRSLRLTDAGERFLGHARQLVDGWDVALAEVQSESPKVHGTLRVSVPAVFGVRHVVPALDGFLKEHTELAVDLMLSDRYVNLLDEGLDVAIRVGVSVPSTLRARRLGGTPRWLVASPAYLSRHGEPRSPADLTKHAALVHTGVPRSIWALSRADTTERVSVGGRVRADQSDALLALALQGHGVALLARWLVDDAVNTGALTRLLPDWSAPPAPIRALLPPSRRVPVRVRAFLEHLEEAWAGSLLRM